MSDLPANPGHSPLTRLPTPLWRMAAAVALGAVVLISVVYVVAMIVVALRGRLSGR